MKSCRLQYLDQLPVSVTQREVGKLTEIHHQLSRKVREAGGDTNPLFVSRDGYTRYSAKVARQAQDTFIQQLNEQMGAEVVRVMDMEDHDGVIQIVGVDVRPLLKKHLSQDELTETDEADSIWTGIGINELDMVAQTDLARSLKSLSLAKDPTGNYQYTNSLHKNLFDQVVADLRQKLYTYKDLIERGNVPGIDSSVRLQEINDQIKALETESDMETVEAMSAFVVHSCGWLDAVFSNFFTGPQSTQALQRELDLNRNLTTGEALTPEEKQERMTAVADQLAKARHFMYLFNDLAVFQTRLNKLRGKDFVEDQTVERGPGFTKELNDWLDTQQVSPGRREVINNFLQNPRFTMQGLRVVLQQQLERAQPDAWGSVLTNKINNLFGHLQDTYPAKSAEGMLGVAVVKADQLKNALAEQHYQLVASWIWPRIQEKQKDRKEEDKLIRDPRQGRDDIVDLLRTAGEDAHIFNYNLDSPSQSSDPITAIVAGLVSDAVYAAAGESRYDILSLSATRDKLGLEKLGTEGINQYHREMVHDTILVMDGVDGGLADADWKGPVVDVSIWPGQIARMKGYVKRAILTEYNTSRWEATRKYFQATYKGEVQKLWDLVPKDADGNFIPNEQGRPQLFGPLFNELYAMAPQSIYHQAILDTLFKQNKKGEWMTTTTGRVLNDVPLAMEGAMKKAFYRSQQQMVPEGKLTALLKTNGVLPGKVTTLMNRWLAKNSRASKLYGELEDRRKDFLDEDTDLVQMTDARGHKLIYAQLRVYDEVGEERPGYYTYEWVDLHRAGALQEVVHVFYATGELIQPVGQYHVLNNGFGSDVARQYRGLQDQAEKFAYYQQLLEKYEQGGNKLGRTALKHGVLPQVEKLGNVDIGQEGWLARLMSWIKQHTFVKSIRDSYNWLAQKEETAPAMAGQRAYLNGAGVQEIPARYTTTIPDEDLEEDLFRSMLMYKAGANTYRALQEIDSPIQALKTLIKGDTLLGIDARKAKGEDWTAEQIGKLLRTPKQDQAKRLNRKLGAFLDDVIYGEQAFAAQFKIGNKTVNLSRIGEGLSGFTALSSLAWNVSSMGGNIGVGFLANYSEGVKGKYYYPKDWRDAFTNYWKNIGNVYGDLNETNPANWSKLTQLAHYLDAIQGEILDDQGNISRTGTTEKLMNRMLFFTQSGAEHMIQTLSMEAQLRGYKLPDGRSLWDAVNYVKGQPITFDGVDPKVLREFQQQLHAVNKQLHGHYAKLDKALIQRHWLGQMAMMFKKYIYASFRYRFGGERFDWEAGDETEGHLHAYWRKLQTELKENQTMMQKAGILANGMLGKLTVGSLDQLSGGLLSRMAPVVGNYAYGDESEARNSAARQTAFDVMWYSLVIMMAAMIHGLDDEEDPNGLVLANMEVLARRMQGDLGMYLPGFGVTGIKSALSTYDKGWQLIKSPMAQLRTYDGTVSLFLQATGDLADLEMETYKRDGPGYSKGDTKLGHQLEKSVFSPYYQVLKFMSPKAQLEYFNLTQRNSK